MDLLLDEQSKMGHVSIVETDLLLDEQSKLSDDSSVETNIFPDEKAKPDHDALLSRTTRALSLATKFAFDEMHSDGHWCGELASNVTVTAEQIMFLQKLGLDKDVDGKAYESYLLSEQNPDGSWGVAPDYPGDVSTTSEAYLALKILGLSEDAVEMQRARNFVIRAGGLAKARIFTRIFFAQFGLFPWEALPQLPTEFILVPATSPISIYRMSSWARSNVVPLLIICHHRPIYALPNGLSAQNDYLDELWINPADKMVPFSPPLSELWENDLFGFTFALLDKILYGLGGLRYSPLRGYARRKCVRWLWEHQENAGDWAGILPPMHSGIQALLLEGIKIEDPRIQRGLQAIERFSWQDERGKRVQASLSPVWDTVLMARALCDAGADPNDERLRRSIRWTKARQLQGPEGDWRIYKPNIVAGGFAFEYHNSWYPDIDDTAAVILAFLVQNPQSVESDCVARAANWICGMQNRDGGWGAFDHDNDKSYLNKIPFSDMDSLCDPSTPDVTGRILEAFGMMIQISREEYLAPDILNRITEASEQAIAYLRKNQESDGSFFGRWASNYIYGTCNALIGLSYFSEGNNMIQGLQHSAALWLKRAQNTDGGWGEDLQSYNDRTRAGRGPSTPSQTAWALMGLLAYSSPSDDAIRRGVAHLLSSQTDTVGEGASWPERLYTGTGFPGHFYIGYALYRHYFPMTALGRYAQAVRDEAHQNIGEKVHDWL